MHLDGELRKLIELWEAYVNHGSGCPGSAERMAAISRKENWLFRHRKTMATKVLQIRARFELQTELTRICRQRSVSEADVMSIRRRLPDLLLEAVAPTQASLPDEPICRVAQRLLDLIRHDRPDVHNMEIVRSVQQLAAHAPVLTRA